MTTSELRAIKKIPVLNKTISLREPCKVVKVLPNIKEDVLYEQDICDFMPGESLRNLRIVNKLNLLNHTSKTVAGYVSVSGEPRERTSDDIVKLIGQANYDTVLSSLCSVISQELKIRGILSLLTVPKQHTATACQTSSIVKVEPPQVDKPVRRRRKRQSTPYVVKDVPKKVVISPTQFTTFCKTDDKDTSLPDLRGNISLDGNSIDSMVTSITVQSSNQLLLDPVSLISDVEKCTLDSETQKNNELQQKLSIIESGGSEMCIADQLNYTCAPVSQMNMTVQQRNRMKMRQAVNDYKYCLLQDEDGNYPIHVAVLNNDVELLRRQCLMLKIRNGSVDLLACKTLTALKMALYQENANLTATLLQYGADPLLVDEDYNTAFHIAAEMGGGHMRAILSHCTKNVRRILQEEDKLWKPEYETKDDKVLSEIFLGYACSMYNNQGYSPLMLASRVGNFENIRLLLHSVRSVSHVNLAMPNCGETALYAAVTASILYSVDQGNKSKVADHFRQTIIALLEHGADPNLVTFSNSSVHDLIQESSCVELANLIGTSNTAKITGTQQDSANVILIKEKDKSVRVQTFSPRISLPSEPVKQPEVDPKRQRYVIKTASNSGPSIPVITRNISLPNMTSIGNENVPSISTSTARSMPIISPSMRSTNEGVPNTITRGESIPNVNTSMQSTGNRNVRVPIASTGQRNIPLVYVNKVDSLSCNVRINPYIHASTATDRYTRKIPVATPMPVMKFDNAVSKPNIKIIEDKIMRPTQAINLSKTAVAVKRKSSINTATTIKRPNTND